MTSLFSPARWPTRSGCAPTCWTTTKRRTPRLAPRPVRAYKTRPRRRRPLEPTTNPRNEFLLAIRTVPRWGTGVRTFCPTTIICTPVNPVFFARVRNKEFNETLLDLIRPFNFYKTKYSRLTMIKVNVASSDLHLKVVISN